MLIPELARVARDGIHEPEPHAVRQRLDRPARGGLAHRASPATSGGSVDAWDVNSLGAPVRRPRRRCPDRRAATDGRGLSRAARRSARDPGSRSPSSGRGLGTEMRAAVLHFGFQVLGAELAVTGAFPTNKGSIRVSEKLGYLPNGVRRDRVRGRPVDSVLFRLPRELWESSPAVPVEVEGFEGCERLFGLDAAAARSARCERAAVWDDVGVALATVARPSTSSTRSTSTSPRPRLRSSRRWRPSRRAIPWYGSLHRGGGRKSAHSTTLFEEARALRGPLRRL